MNGAKAISIETVLKDVYQLPDVKNKIIDLFGPFAISEDGNVDLYYLDAFINTNPDIVEQLQEIIYTPAHDIVKLEIEDATEKAVVVESSLLFEVEFNQYCDYTVYLFTPLADRKKRAAASIYDFIYKTVSIDEPEEARAQQCDRILYNTENIEYLDAYAKLMMRRI